MPQELTHEMTTLVQAMAWCLQAPSHCLHQCWPSSIMPYGITRPYNELAKEGKPRLAKSQLNWVNLKYNIFSTRSHRSLTNISHYRHTDLIFSLFSISALSAASRFSSSFFCCSRNIARRFSNSAWPLAKFSFRLSSKVTINAKYLLQLFIQQKIYK